MKRIITSALLLFALLNVHGQYMSFFGDSTWEYHVTYLTQTPEDYLNSTPQSPTPLNAYCQTFTVSYNKSVFEDSTQRYLPLCTDSVTLLRWSRLYEDTVNGRLYVDTRGWGNEPFRSILVCDMSLSEGDTFVLEDPGFYPSQVLGDNTPEGWLYETVGDRTMLVDSVRYIEGRKTIFLSLIDHQDDYFFGTDYAGQRSGYNFTVRFIEGIGASYGLLPGRRYPSYSSDLYPTMGLMLCMYKDGSMEYMADATLGCDQTSLGLTEQPQQVMNLYPNPATQYVVLDMSAGEEMNGVVAITDMMGRQCLQQRAEGSSVRVPVSALPAGMYFLTYTDGNMTITRKFLKE